MKNVAHAGREVAVCASRSSALAMTQARIVAAKLAQGGIASTILNVTTTGDRFTDRPLAAIGSENLFVKELESALRERDADYAVHSCKDLSSTLPADMAIAAISAREDPRDVLCSERFENFAALPEGARVGTSSPRRRAQLHALRPDLRYEDVRGNVDTRLRKLREGNYDAIVLAAAGLKRLGATCAHVAPFDCETVVPAAGQGALAVETLASNVELARVLRAAVNDERAELAVLCERSALRALRGGCQAPIGIHAFDRDGCTIVIGAYARADDTLARAQASAVVTCAPEAEALGISLAKELACI